MKKSMAICFSIAIFMFITTTTLAIPKQIKFCLSSYPPFVMYDKNHQLSGFDIELVKTLCKEMKVNCEFSVQPTINNILSTLNSNKCDAWISGLTITPERKKDMAFTIPYYPSTVSFIIPSKSKSTSSIKDLTNKKIGVGTDTIFITYLKKAYGNNIKIVTFTDNNDALTALKNNQVDAVIADSPTLYYWDAQNNQLDFRIISLSYNYPDYSFGDGYGIAVKKENTELLTALNEAINKIKSSNINNKISINGGVYNKIVKKYFTDLTTFIEEP